jgi:hypothetical protein
MPRVDDRGCALAGSQLQLQIYVNRREQELSAAVLQAFPDLLESGASLEWKSPLEAERFAEYRDGAFLQAVGLSSLTKELRDFWPARGPVWDGLAVYSGARGRGVVLAEGKSYPREFYSGGTRAGPDSLERIRSALAETQRWLGVEPEPDRWTSSLYQSANRYAALYWLREICGVDAKLVHVLFENDSTFKGSTRAEWEAALPEIEADLGLAGVHLPHAAHVFLPARSRDELS